MASEIEIHAMNIISGKREFQGMKINQRLEIFEKVLSITHILDCTINCIVIRKNLLKTKTSDEIDEIAFKLLFERLFYSLKDLNHKLYLDNKDTPQFGISFMNHIQEKQDRKIKEKIRRLIQSGTKYIPNDYLIEDVIFVDSRYRALSQIVD